jgi:3-isopropylmalate/(R)-2-methylmalate dehydratase small subunit
MQAVKTIISKAVPLPLKDVDTDLIIPAQFLTSISREGFRQNLFHRLKASDPNCALNQPQYAGAQILLTDSNFGCGSSREHAVWAIQGAGFRAVVAKSFADIFYNNSAKNGLLLVTLPAPVVDELLARAQKEPVELTVDLEKREVRTNSGETYEFQYDEFRRHCLLNGLDDIDYIRSFEKEIADHRAAATQFAACETSKSNKVPTTTGAKR